VAAPAGVAQRVDHRGPDVQPAPVRVLMVEAAYLLPDRVAHGAYQFRVPGGAEPDRLREDGGRSQPGEPVQCLGAGAERADAQPGDRCLVLVQEGDLLLNRELGEQCGDPPGDVGRGICGHRGRPPRSTSVFGAGSLAICRSASVREVEALRQTATEIRASTAGAADEVNLRLAPTVRPVNR